MYSRLHNVEDPVQRIPVPSQLLFEFQAFCLVYNPLKPIEVLPIRAHHSSKHIFELLQRVTGMTYDKVGLLRWNLSCDALVPYCTLKAFKNNFKANHLYVKPLDAVRRIVERANPTADGAAGMDQSDNGGCSSNSIHIEGAREASVVMYQSCRIKEEAVVDL